MNGSIPLAIATLLVSVQIAVPMSLQERQQYRGNARPLTVE
jgi:hypothetical protein